MNLKLEQSEHSAGVIDLNRAFAGLTDGFIGSFSLIYF